MKSVPHKAQRASHSAQRTEGVRKGGRAPLAKAAANRRSEPTTQLKSTGGQWTFLTNHSHVLIILSRESSIVLRELAVRVGITERAVQRIVADLEGEGFIERKKIGRRNHYRILRDRALRHPIEAHHSIGEFLALLGKEPGKLNTG